jgi:transcriptional regulator with XRE-family HTH domain
LAELANVGPNYIRQIEAGKPTAHIEKVLDVMAALGLQFKLEFGKEKIKL